MDIAQTAIQRGGYRAFSFRDIAEALGIKTAAVHYHFRHKDDLGLEVIGRYRADFFDRLEESPDSSAAGRLRHLAALFAEPLAEGRICLCAAVISDASIVSDPMSDSAARFLDDLGAWITGVIAEGRETGHFRTDPSAGALSARYLSLLYGGMLIARSRRSAHFLGAVSESFLDDLTT